MEYQFKQHFAAVYKMLEEEGSGVIRVAASSFGNEDVYGDVFEVGAFDASISSISKDNRLPMLFNHDPSKVIGHWYKAEADSEFLYMEGKLSLGHSLADDIYINLKNGDIGGVSIGFNSDDAVERRDDKGRYEGMTFNKVSLMENSVVTFPANPKAGVSEVKSSDARATQIRAFEKRIKELARDAKIPVSRRDVDALTKSAWSDVSTNQTERDAGQTAVTADSDAFLSALEKFKI